jgi:16S rRNA (uracil1498-N3)-methyltransferase
MQIFLLTIDPEQRAWLNEEESRHCLRVLRHNLGDQLIAVDGQGMKYEAEIIGVGGKQVELRLLSQETNWGEHGKRLHLGISPLRLRDRFEWVVEKSVEMGVTDLYPLRCARTDPYKSKFKAARLETLMQTAMKQCKRSLLPRLHPLTPLADWLTEARSGARFMGWCEASQHLKQWQGQLETEEEVHLLIGPEGDFSLEEVQLAESQQFLPVSLGTQRLRTETAALYALSLIKTAWEY